jgi:hypothetical protein
VRDVLDADITYRARRLADAGVAATLNELDPPVSWRDDALRFAYSDTWELDLSGGELVLIPSVFAWPHSAVSFDLPAVIYPARGIGDIWQPGSPSGDDLARLIGRARAALLTALAKPASTTGLAARPQHVDRAFDQALTWANARSTPLGVAARRRSPARTLGSAAAGGRR